LNRFVIKGKAHKFGDDVNTDYIISGKYKFKTLDMKELASHLFEDLVPGFTEKVQKGDLVVAGRNFGCGSSREQAPLVIKEAGISCVVAKSFARIFYRNAINVGLPVVQWLLKDLTTGETLTFEPLPAFMQSILREGGLVEYVRRHGTLDAGD